MYSLHRYDKMISLCTEFLIISLLFYPIYGAFNNCNEVYLELKREINFLEKENGVNLKLQREIDYLKRENGILHRQLTDISTRLDHAEVKLVRQDKIIMEQQRYRLVDLQTGHNKSDESHRHRRAAESHVAFTYSNDVDLINIGIDQTVIFNTKVTDILSSYDSVRGEFTAKVPGYYFFSMNIRSRGGTTCRIDIVKNGHALVTTFNDEESGSASVVVHLRLGEIVWVRNKGYHSDQCDIGDSSIFSGFLLYPD